MRMGRWGTASVLGIGLCAGLARATQAQEPQPPGDRWRAGVQYGQVLFHPKGVNRVIDDYLSQATITYGTEEVLFGYDAALFLARAIDDTWEVRADLGFFLSPKFLAITGDADLDLIITSIFPGMSVHYARPLAGRLRGRATAGVYRHYGRASWSGGIDDVWTGQTTGLDLGLGVDMAPTATTSVGALLIARSADIPLRHGGDRSDGRIPETGALKPRNLDLSGLQIRVFYAHDL